MWALALNLQFCILYSSKCFHFCQLFLHYWGVTRSSVFKLIQKYSKEVFPSPPILLLKHRKQYAGRCLNLLKPEHLTYLETRFVPHRKHCLPTTMINWLMLLITVYCENHMKYINTLRGQNIVYCNAEAGGACRYHSTPKSSQMCDFSSHCHIM
jgi:hypothetical protein